MDNKRLEPAAFLFPLPADLKEQYMKWSRSSQPSPGNAKVQGNNEEQGYTPIFIPVYPAYPGSMPFPPFSPENPSGTSSCRGGSAAWPLGNNPFILFLILILLLLGTRKEQILAVIRKLLLEPEKKTKKA